MFFIILLILDKSVILELPKLIRLRYVLGSQLLRKVVLTGPQNCSNGPFGNALETKHCLYCSPEHLCPDLCCCSNQPSPGNRALFAQICPLYRQGGLTLRDEVDPLMALMLQGSQPLLTHACKYPPLVLSFMA